MLLIINVIERLFSKTAKSVTSAAKAKAERETIGKVEGKVQASQQKMEQKAMRAVSGVGPGSLKRGDSGPDAAAAGGAPRMPEPQNVGYMPPPNVAQQPVEQPMSYQQGPPPGGGLPPAQPAGVQAPHSKTVMIDPSQLSGGTHVNKPVVGWIVCMAGQQKGQDFRLHDGRNIIGTAADCDVVIFDPYIGARHCLIEIDSKQANYVVVDLDSKNGTYVNRTRVTKQHLIDNDEVRMGQVEFRFKSLY